MTNNQTPMPEATPETPRPRLPLIKDLRALFIELKADIRDDYRADYDEPGFDEEDTIPSMLVTIGAKTDPAEYGPEDGALHCDWSYQTGDNSYTGGAYGYRDWAVIYLCRRANSTELARDTQDQLAELYYGRV